MNDFPIPGIQFRDITALSNSEGFQKTCKRLTELTENFSAEIVVSIESRGLFLPPVANDLLLPFVLAVNRANYPMKHILKVLI